MEIRSARWRALACFAGLTLSVGLVSCGGSAHNPAPVRAEPSTPGAATPDPGSTTRPAGVADAAGTLSEVLDAYGREDWERLYALSSLRARAGTSKEEFTRGLQTFVGNTHLRAAKTTGALRYAHNGDQIIATAPALLTLTDAQGHSTSSPTTFELVLEEGTWRLARLA